MAGGRLRLTRLSRRLTPTFLGSKVWDRGAPRRLAIFFAVLAFAGGAVWWTCIRMPGASHAGPLPALDVDERALAEELRRDVTVLAREIGVRNAAHRDALERAAAYVESELARAGLSPQRERFTYGGESFANVLVEIRGTAHPDERFVVGAHYDSAPASPGGNDNGTGTAALLALARRFAGAPAARTLRFVAFTNEEPPFFGTAAMGSAVDASAARARGDRVVAMLSLETLGCYSDEEGSQAYPMPWLRYVYPSRGNFVAFVGSVRDRDLVRDAVAAFRASTPFPSEGAALPAFVSGADWSDHRSFSAVGYPALMVTDTATFRDRAYHTADDDAAHVDYERFARVVSGLARTMRVVATR